MIWWTVSQLKSKNPDVRAGALEKIGASEDASLISIVIPFLSDPEARVRIAAAEALGKLGDAGAVVPLSGAIRDPDSTVRLAVVKSLRILHADTGVNALVDALHDSAAEVAGHAAAALRQFTWEPSTPRDGAAYRIGLGQFDAAIAYGAAAVEPLARLTRNAPFHLCIRAIEALSRTGDPQAVKPLLDCLRHKEDIVRSCAAGALGQVGDARAVEPLLRALADPNRQITLAASSSLGKLGDHRAVDPLIELLAHKSSEVRASAVETLGKLRDLRATQPVVALLKDADKEVREVAAVALGLLRDERAIEPLVLALTDLESSVRQAAIRALRLTDPYWEQSEHAMRAVPELESCLKSKEYWVRTSATEVLAKLGMTQARESTTLGTESDSARQKRKAGVDILVSMLNDHDRDFRLAAAEALGRIDAADVVPALVARLSDTDRYVQTATAKSLEALRWEPREATDRARFLVALEKWTDLVALGAPAIDSLAAVISWGEGGTRRRAIESLVQIGGAQVVSALITIAADPSDAVRADARAALSMLGHGSERKESRFAT